MGISPAVLSRAFGWSALVCLAAMAAGTAIAQPSAAQKPPAAQPPAEKFRDQTSVVLIEVPVEVTLGGEPVRDLRADQFTILVDGKSVAVTGFEQIDVGATGAEQIEGGAGAERVQSLPAVARRRLLFLFDLNAKSVGRLGMARDAATAMLEQLTPTDLVAVGTFSAAKGIELALHYSPDRQQVRDAVARLGKGQPLAARDPLKLILRTNDDMASGSIDMPGTRGMAEGRDPGQKEAAIEAQYLSDRGVRSREQGDAVTFLRDITSVGEICRSVEGRKHVVLFSEGFDEQLIGGTTDEDERQDLQRTASENGEFWKIDSDHYFGSQRVASGIDKVVDALRRADCSLHTVDLAGMGAAGSVAGKSAKGTGGLFALSAGTGGTHFENFNQIGQAVDELLERTQVAYLMAFQADDIKPDGKFHKIKVEAKGLPKGARIHHRPGFFAPDAKRAPDGLEQVLAMGNRLFDDRRTGELGMRAAAFALEDPGKDGRANVPLLIEIDAFKKESGAAPIDVLIYAFDKDGSVADVVAQRFAWDLAAGSRGLKALVPLLLPAGQVTLRVLAREPATGATALAVVDLVVPSRNVAADSALLAALVPSTFDGWQPARAQRVDLPTPPDHPFVIAESFYAPAVNPRVTAASTMPLILLGEDLYETTLFDADGKKVADLTLTAVKSERSQKGYGLYLREITLPKGLANGAYSLTVGDQRVPFTVVAAGDPSLTPLSSLGGSR
jgi:VWFA-related protein